jgi:hypothetical protein
MGGLDLEELFHHRRDARRRLGRLRGVWWNRDGLLDGHGGGSYKILARGPIGLPDSCAFSTLPGHNRPCANAPLGGQSVN